MSEMGSFRDTEAKQDWPWDLEMLHRVARDARVLLLDMWGLQELFREMHERAMRRDMGLSPDARLVLMEHARIVSWMERASREIEVLGNKQMQWHQAAVDAARAAQAAAHDGEGE